MLGWKGFGSRLDFRSESDRGLDQPSLEVGFDILLSQKIQQADSAKEVAGGLKSNSGHEESLVAACGQLCSGSKLVRVSE